MPSRPPAYMYVPQCRDAGARRGPRAVSQQSPYLHTQLDWVGGTRVTASGGFAAQGALSLVPGRKVPHRHVIGSVLQLFCQRRIFLVSLFEPLTTCCMPSPARSTASVTSGTSSTTSSRWSSASGTASRIVSNSRAYREQPTWAKTVGAPSMYIGPWQVS